MVLLSLAALGVGAYSIANFHAPKFGTVVFIYSLTLWAFENMAQTMSTLFRNPLIGMLLFVCTWCVPPGHCIVMCAHGAAKHDELIASAKLVCSFFCNCMRASAWCVARLVCTQACA